MYPSTQTLSAIANYVSFVFSSMICFASQIFLHMNKCFSRSSDASHRNYGNLIVGSCLAILNCVELLPPCGVDNLLLLPELAPPVDFP
jgi:hypothetical protein